MGDPREIEIVGDADAGGASAGASRSATTAPRWSATSCGSGRSSRFQKLFFHTPLVNVFILGSEAYHDYYRWPLRDRRIFQAWQAGTAWGRLFRAYASGTAPAGQQRAAVAGVP